MLAQRIISGAWWRFLLRLACLPAAALAGAADSPRGGPVFKDCSAEVGLQLANAAACWVDVNNDGWTDLCAGGVLWRNNGGTNFTKMAEGLRNVVAADFDNDGFADLFSWSWSEIFVYRNNAGKNFSGIALPALPKTFTRGGAWGDFNGDGFVDLYLGGYEDGKQNLTMPSMILMNEKGQGFRLEWTETRFRARGVTACDFNQDGALDVYVSNYRLQPNLLWLNDGKGKFRDVAAEYNALATSPGFAGGHSIGACWGDFDNDGRFDLFAGNFAHQDNRGDQPKSRFLRNLGPPKQYHFEDRGPCGIFYQESYASPAAGDYDNDGNLDLFFTTVYATASKGVKNFPELYRNDDKFVFNDITSQAGLAGLEGTYQAAWADFDNDGDLDLATAGKLFRNQGGGGNWLKVKLEGDGKAVNRSAIGAQVRIKVKNEILTRQVEAGTGECNQNDLTLHFGLGRQAAPVSVEITWPDGTKQKISDVKPGTLLPVRYNGK
jgi:hypothetical protein